jgi:hypothetical protein
MFRQFIPYIVDFLQFFEIISFLNCWFVSPLCYIPAFGGFWNLFNNIGLFRYWVRFLVYYMQASSSDFAIPSYVFGLFTVVTQVFSFIFFFSLSEDLPLLPRLSRDACLLPSCIASRFIESPYLRFFVPQCLPPVPLYRECHPAFSMRLSYRRLSSWIDRFTSSWKSDDSSKIILSLIALFSSS